MGKVTEGLCKAKTYFPEGGRGGEFWDQFPRYWEQREGPQSLEHWENPVQGSTKAQRAVRLPKLFCYAERDPRNTRNRSISQHLKALALKQMGGSKGQGIWEHGLTSHLSS